VYRPAAAAPPPPNTEVFAYPQQGQTPQQADRDRYDCHEWAVKQSNFDPSAPGTPPHDQVRVAMKLAVIMGTLWRDHKFNCWPPN
jgi:hypothetical protein